MIYEVLESDEELERLEDFPNFEEILEKRVKIKKAEILEEPKEKVS